MTWPTNPNGGGQNVTNYDALLGARKTPSASFKGQFPIAWEGTVEDVTKKLAFEYDPSKPNNRGVQRFWPDGNPIEELWITLQTTVRTDQDDDGRRVLVLDSKNKLEAVQQAVRESGASFAQGGRLYIEWYGNDDANAKNPQNPPKLYRARYQGPTFDSALNAAPPTQSAQGGWGQQAAAPAPASPAPGTGGWGNPPQQAASAAQGGWGGSAQNSAPQAAPAGNWGAPAPQAPPAQPDPQTYDEFVAAFRRKGVDPSTITSPEQAAQVWAYVKNNPDVA